MTKLETAIIPSPLISSDLQRLGGWPCFTGTRVPVQNLFDYVEGGHTLDEFLLDFPGVPRAHAEAVLALSKGELVAEYTRFLSEALASNDRHP